MSNDLSDFIADKEILLISDFEGTTPTAHFNNFKTYCTEGGDKRVIFLGDVFDNTVQLGETECTGDDCKDPDLKHTVKGKDGKPDDHCDITDENYCSLKTIELLVDNGFDGKNTCRYVIGNRDINKIKILPFFSCKKNINGGQKWWVADKSGNKFENYVEIVKNLFEILKEAQEKKEVPWIVPNMDLFKPFFNMYGWNKKKNEKEWAKTQWDYPGETDKDGKVIPSNKSKRDQKHINNNIYDRFEAIFGKDATVGSMSALLTLKCVPNEMFGGSRVKEMYKEIVGIDYPEAKIRKEIRAALSIAIFMRMLDKNLWPGNPTDGTFKENEFKLDGYLYYYLKTAPTACYATYDKNLLLFAHGGISKEFIEGDGKTAFEKLNKVDWAKALELDLMKRQTAGGTDIKNYINKFNEQYFDILAEFITSDYEYIGTSWGKKPTAPGGHWAQKFYDDINKLGWNNMLILLQLSAMARNKNIADFKIEESPIQVKEPSKANLDVLPFTKIYNIFGHASSSAGYSFGKVSDKTYFVNTDFSTTLYKEGISCKRYNENSLILTLQCKDNKIHLSVKGDVVLNDKYKQVSTEEFSSTIDEYIEKQITPKKDQEADPNFKKIGALKYYIEGGLDLPDKTYTFEGNDGDDVIPLLDTIETPKKSSFNGISKIGSKRYYTFSTNYMDVDKVKLLYFKPIEEEQSGEAPQETEVSREELLGESTTDGGGRKRRTRKRRGTKKAKKGGKRKTKKGGRKTRRNYK